MSSVLTENIVLSRTRSHDLRNVKKLNCWGSELSDISIVRRMPNVEVLSLSLNNIASLQDFSLCKYLQELYLRKNKISDINEIYYLQDLPNLKKLSLEDNPCNQHANYRYTIIKALPRLETLDNTNVTSEEVTKAQTLGDDIYDPSSEQPSYPPLNGHSHQKLTIQQQHQQLPDDEDYETYDEDLELSREVSYTEIYREKDEGTYAYIPESKPLSLTPQNGSNPSIPVENIRNKIQQSTPQPQQQPQPAPTPTPTNQQQIQQQPQPPPPPQQLQGNGLQNQITPQQVSQQHVLSQAQLQQRYSLQEISPDTWNSKESKQVTSNLSSSASSTMLRSQSVSDYNMYNGSICNNSTANCRSNDTKSCISDQTNDLYQFHNENGSGTERYSPLSSHGGNGGTGSCGSSGGSGNGIGTGRRYGYQSIQSISSQQKPLSKGGRNRNGNILSAVLCLIKELDYASLEVVETAIHCRMEEMED